MSSRPVFIDTSPVYESWQPKAGDLVRFRYTTECICPNCGKEPGHLKSSDSVIAHIDQIVPIVCVCCGFYLPGHKYKTLNLWGAAASELELVVE